MKSLKTLKAGCGKPLDKGYWTTCGTKVSFDVNKSFYCPLCSVLIQDREDVLRMIDKFKVLRDNNLSGVAKRMAIQFNRSLDELKSKIEVGGEKSK